MNLSLEAIDALINASNARLVSLETDIEDLSGEVRRGGAEHKPALELARTEAAGIRAALLEAFSYRDHLRRISR